MAGRFKDEKSKFDRLNSNAISKARAALEDANKQFADDVRLYYVPKLRESLADFITERPDAGFIGI